MLGQNNFNTCQFNVQNGLLKDVKMHNEYNFHVKQTAISLAFCPCIKRLTIGKSSLESAEELFITFGPN